MYDFDELTDIEAENPCLICMEERNETSIKTTCKHEFHKPCIEKHMKHNHYDGYQSYKNNLCPYCSKILSKKFTSVTTCETVFKSGKNKGNKCGKPVFNYEHKMCKTHYNSYVKQLKKNTINLTDELEKLNKSLNIISEKLLNKKYDANCEQFMSKKFKLINKNTSEIVNYLN